MSSTVPPIPHKAPLTDSKGLLTPAWSGWFRMIFERLGGNVALTNIELATVQTQDLVTLQQDVATLQAQVSALQSSIGDFNQGPYL